MLLETSLLTVFLAALVTALATGLGAIPLAIVRQFSVWWTSLGAAVAAGLMLAASHSLVVEGAPEGAWLVLVGMASGLGLVVLADRWIDRADAPGVGDLKGADARKALLIVGVMTAHSFAEGVGVGVAFGGGQELGTFITVAIAVHNIPEGLAIALVLVPRGVPVWQAAWWAVFSSLPQPLMAIPAYLFVTTFEPFLPIGLGLAAGAMIWMVLAEMLPDALRHLSSRAVGASVVLAFMVMLAFQLLIAR
ncbi:ZIP family metal transporter [Guyparkeria hydrothermalis]|uniref:ZIP family metal transporter n=1 Tax=Guyparkeria hydrothermalis TaxID=923 RepID=UPI00201FDE55|nr:ZIP family metal transporter [Guyparkeria hydrothermalis]MCL7745098.1 ZIP family metal transporter [Guyparkeria hydrothermalis]